MTDVNLDRIWADFIAKLQNSTSAENFNMYISHLQPLAIEGNVLRAQVNSAFLKNAIEEKFMTVLNGILTEITNNSKFHLELSLAQDSAAPVEKEAYQPIPLFHNQQPAQESDNFNNNLNSTKRFDNFVVGNSNRFACAAAQAVGNSAPGQSYNPLFIYGSSGLGKTHLIQAIGNKMLELNSQLKVLYLTTETFTNEMIVCLKNNTMDAFRKKYRGIDCLIIDDIQFLKGKIQTQEEFFNTFNTLTEAKKEIVISSDRPPKDLDGLEERLRSRFASGLTADIQQPDTETKIAILRKKAEAEHVNIPNDVIQMIAMSISSNIRMIEGAFIKIVAFSSLMKEPITVDLARKVLDDMGNPVQSVVTIDKIIEYICATYKLKLEDILSHKRSKDIAEPRQIAMYLCRKLTDISLPRIGSKFGRDHTTVIHACEKITKLCKEDKSFNQLLEKYEQEISNS
ncbi:MAG: chromosomal replication initiator protein DnaA [Acidaminococcaceae bacterium]|jgi:chromosomal replication initiator protein|nr:chromosomal replication initiator protein DnaA [Acidaminococcaceae bacterium]